MSFRLFTKSLSSARLVARKIVHFELSTSTAAFNNSLQKSEFWNKKMRKVIEVGDTDGDGRITIADIDIIGQRYKEMGASEENVFKFNNAFTKLSTLWGITEDNSLSYEEFTKNFIALSDRVDREPTAYFLETFALIDTDGDDEISLKEWTIYNKALGIDPKHSQESFDAMDANGDGKVSKDEFLAYNIEFYYSVEDKLKSSILYGPLE